MHGWLSEISIKGVDGQETWLVRSSLRPRRITVPSASSSDWHLGLTTPHLIQPRTFQSTRSTSTTNVDMWMRLTVTSQYRILSKQNQQSNWMFGTHFSRANALTNIKGKRKRRGNFSRVAAKKEAARWMGVCSTPDTHNAAFSSLIDRPLEQSESWRGEAVVAKLWEFWLEATQAEREGVTRSGGCRGEIN